MALIFQWDEAKNAANQRKHGISFEEAAKAFDDPYCVTELERIENGEQRWQTFGFLNAVLLAMVAHTWRDDAGDEYIRVISARFATPKERRDHERKNR
jgi:uncharacterized protein